MSDHKEEDFKKSEKPEDKFKPLNKESVDYVIDMINEDIHPIDDTSLKKAFPWLCFCWICDWPKSRSAQAESNANGNQDALLKKNKKKAKSSKKSGDVAAVAASPILKYGFGISIYLKMMFSLSIMFSIFTLLCMPIFSIYMSGDAYKYGSTPLYEDYSLGRLGYATQKCVNQPLAVGSLTLDCPYGVIGNLLDYGYNDFKQTERTDICQSNEITDLCKPNNRETLEELTSYLGDSTANWEFNIGKFFTDSKIPDTCEFKGDVSDPKSLTDAYIFVSYECHHLPETQFERYNQVVFIGIIGILISFLFLVWIRWQFQGSKIDLIEFDCATITAGDYTVEIKFNKEEYNDWYENEYRPKLMDTGISTALALKNQLRGEVQAIIRAERNRQDGYFASGKEVKSHKSMTDKEKKKKAKKEQNKKDKIAEMKKKKLEAIDASKSTKDLRDDEQDDFDNVMVADITFAYRNQDLIELLTARGAALNALDFDTVLTLEKEIDQKKNDPVNFEAWSQPEACFITFEADDAKETAEMASGFNENDAEESQKYKLFNGKKVFKVEDICSEPTDIIWQNRYLTQFDLCKRSLIAISLSVGLLIASFFMLYGISVKQAEQAKYFPTRNCGPMIDAYGMDKLETYAYYDFLTWQENLDSKNVMATGGQLECYCTSEDVTPEAGVEYTEEQKNTMNENMTRDYKNNDDDVAYPICQVYTDTAATAYFINSSLGYMVTGVNWVIRTIIITLITWIHYKTETAQLTAITLFTFLAQFFNTAFLFLMVNANMSEQPLTFALTSGSFTDFNSGWFKSVGNVLVDAMVFNAWFPIVEIVLYAGIRELYRFCDRGYSFNCSKYNTRSKTLNQYIEISVGGVYYMHFKYSGILNIVYVTLMYGIGLPYLFPTAVAALVILYISEKALLYYSYRQPPSYDQRLSNFVIRMMLGAPVMMLFFGYWMLSSKQLISNDHLTGRVYGNDAELSQHTMGDIFSNDGWNNPAWPMLLMAFICLIFCCFHRLLNELFDKLFPCWEIGDIDPNEDIADYWKTLDMHDLGFSYHEELKGRNLFNIYGPQKFKMMDDYSFGKLEAEYKRRMEISLRIENGETSLSLDPKASVQGAHSYDILANPNYFDDFIYIPVFQPLENNPTPAYGCKEMKDQRTKFIIDNDDDEDNDEWVCDKVRVGLNMAYLHEDVATDFTFSDTKLRPNTKQLKVASNVIGSLLFGDTPKAE